MVTGDRVSFAGRKKLSPQQRPLLLALLGGWALRGRHAGGSNIILTLCNLLLMVKVIRITMLMRRFVSSATVGLRERGTTVLGTWDGSQGHGQYKQTLSVHCDSVSGWGLRGITNV